MGYCQAESRAQQQFRAIQPTTDCITYTAGLPGRTVRRYVAALGEAGTISQCRAPFDSRRRWYLSVAENVSSGKSALPPQVTSQESIT